MSYQTRKTLFEQIENSRQRPLISYVTSIRPNLSGNMTGDSIDQIIAQIQKIPEDKKEIDFLIISNGGDPITALRIISILRERFNKIFQPSTFKAETDGHANQMRRLDCQKRVV